MVGVRRKIRTSMVVAVAMAMAMMLTVSPASAGDLAAVVEGQAHLSGGTPGSGPGTFSGSVVVGTHGTNAPLTGTVSASFSYDNQNLVLGDANGTITFNLSDGSTHTGSFAWERVGLTAIIVFDDLLWPVTGNDGGYALAAFAPVVGTNNAIVVGAGVYSH